MKKCCNQNCRQGRDCEVRMPTQMGMSQQERDLAREEREENKALLLCGLCIVLAMILIDLLECVPS